jgi:hypothetical protein
MIENTFSDVPNRLDSVSKFPTDLAVPVVLWLGHIGNAYSGHATQRRGGLRDIFD